MIEQSVFAEMFRLASEVRGNAYVPYSNFPVAVCLRGESGRLYVGVNVDNASFPETACAEANALGALVSAGERVVTAVLLIGGKLGDGILCTPCGGCRQRLGEFAKRDTPVFVCGPDGLRGEFQFGQLLPHAFGPGNLE